MSRFSDSQQNVEQSVESCHLDHAESSAGEKCAEIRPEHRDLELTDILRECEHAGFSKARRIGGVCRHSESP